MKKMNKNTNENFSVLSNEEQAQVKGGLLLYCEEKRIKLLGRTVTTTQWKMASDGNLGLTVQM